MEETRINPAQTAQPAANPVGEPTTTEVADGFVQVEREPVDQADVVTDAFQDSIYEVMALSEEVVISKQARIVEEIIIGREVEERVETIQETVRRTVVDVQEIQGQTVATDFTEVAHVRAGDAPAAGSFSPTGADQTAGSFSATGADLSTTTSSPSSTEQFSAYSTDTTSQASDPLELDKRSGLDAGDRRP